MNNQAKLSATGKLTRNLKATLSQYHSDHMKQAIQRGMANRVAQGYAVGRPPLGYSITETPGLFKINCQGYVLRKLLKQLTKSKTDVQFMPLGLMFVFCSEEKPMMPWSKTKIKHLLSDPYYAGFISYKGELFKGLHEPLITVEEHRKLLELLKKQKNNNSLKPVDKSL